MIESWFHERTEAGWEVRDENRLLVALVPDALHEREADADRIASAAGSARRTKRLVRAVALLTETLESEVGALRERIRSLVPRLVEDARAIAERMESAGADAISPTWISMHVRELVEAHSELTDKRQRLHELQRLLESADASDRSPASEVRP